MIKLRALYAGKLIQKNCIYQAIISHGTTVLNGTKHSVIYVDVIIGHKLLSTYCWDETDFNRKWEFV